MNRFIGIIVSLLFASYNMFAEDLNQLFLHYTTEEGLSSNNVHDITEDAHGFIWLSTHYGISRFDGKEFKTYYAEQNPNMIRNDIYHAFVLPNGEVSFAGSNFVLFSYDENHSSFKPIPFSSNQQELQYDITGFSIQSDGEGILSSGDGVFLYDKEYALFTRTLEQLKGNTVLVIRKDSFNHYWIGDYKGVYIVNQKGEIQPIGGINEKIEGFYQICKMRGLNGEHGVVMPIQNVRNLHLPDEIINDVKQGNFHIYAISTIEQGIEILTGVPAGKKDKNGKFPQGTVNYLAYEKLKKFAEVAKKR